MNSIVFLFLILMTVFGYTVMGGKGLGFIGLVLLAGFVFGGGVVGVLKTIVASLFVLTPIAFLTK